MKKKIALLALVVCALGTLWLPAGPARAQAGSLTVLGSGAQMDFPLLLHFGVAAESNTAITDIRLHYRVERMAHARITSEVILDFQPDTRVEATWTWDMRKTGGLPPGSAVSYWWTVTDAGGQSLTTQPARIAIEDSRYDWRTLTEGMVTLYWYKGDDSFAGQLMAATQGALTRLASQTGAELESAVKIYIYASSDDLRGSMVFPQEWTGGVAFTRYGIIAIGIAPSDLDWGTRTIAHELTHLVIHQVTFNPYGDLPVWLNEGLAMNAEGPLESVFANVLKKATNDGALASVKSLSSPFPADAEASLLAYAESYSVVSYLIDRYGREKMFSMLNTFRQGSGYDEALEAVYGFDMGGLNQEWQASLRAAAAR